MTVPDPLHASPGNPASHLQQVSAEMQQMQATQQAHQQAMQQQIAALKQELSTTTDTFQQELSALKNTVKTMRESAGFKPPAKGSLSAHGSDAGPNNQGTESGS
ncbi:MAG TPA: hypothetical protein DCE41_24640 [Cytophagales bacterium]|nr:hypothetical protein [Cytophagales bacterium]HAA22724.1 hypothetical protein [Cytophagales bacterium]HAP60321.1 hypothetical protein [Cytophagales bacterium]